MNVYPTQPFRINLLTIAFLLIAALLIMHLNDRRAGGE